MSNFIKSIEHTSITPTSNVQ